MQKFKIAFFDIDGTIIDMNRGVMSKRMEQTLLNLQQENVLICLATGRGPVNLPRFERVNFDAVIAFNGSYCYTQDKIIRKNLIPVNDVQKIIQNATELNRPVALASADRMGANGKDQDLVDYFSFSKSVVTVVPDFDKMATEDIYQIMLGCRAEDHAKLIDGVSGAKVTAWWDRAADIIPATGGKGIAVQEMLDYFQLKKEDAIAFGDGGNDIDMLEAVGMGVAMGNAKADVKAIANTVCGRVDEDGISLYLGL